jgi:hypothetical protein
MNLLNYEDEFREVSVIAQMVVNINIRLIHGLITKYILICKSMEDYFEFHRRL